VKDNSSNSELGFPFWARQYLPPNRLIDLVGGDLQDSARILYFEVLNINLGKDLQLCEGILGDLSPIALLRLLGLLNTFEQPDRLRSLLVGAESAEDDESTDGGAATGAPPAKK
jgi:hypothetical protein